MHPQNSAYYDQYENQKYHKRRRESVSGFHYVYSTIFLPCGNHWTFRVHNCYTTLTRTRAHLIMAHEPSVV